MSFQFFGDCLTLDAAADFSAATNRGLAVKIDNTGKWALCGAGAGNIGDRAHGIITEGSKAGFGTVAQLRGVAEVRSGAAINPADYVKTNAAAKAVSTTTAGDKVFGVVIEGCDAADKYAGVLLFLGGLAY